MGNYALALVSPATDAATVWCVCLLPLGVSIDRRCVTDAELNMIATQNGNELILIIEHAHISVFEDFCAMNAINHDYFVEIPSRKRLSSILKVLCDIPCSNPINGTMLLHDTNLKSSILLLFAVAFLSTAKLDQIERLNSFRALETICCSRKMKQHQPQIMKNKQQKIIKKTSAEPVNSHSLQSKRIKRDIWLLFVLFALDFAALKF